ncbi:MAG: hypothetical protein AAF391_04285, partial [Bacteroidota bacterium]
LREKIKRDESGEIGQSTASQARLMTPTNDNSRQSSHVTGQGSKQRKSNYNFKVLCHWRTK